MANKNNNFDLTVIGTGPGGYIAAIRAVQLGMKVAVIEREKFGGICLNWGCIPSKSLLKNAEIYNLFKRADDFGISCDNLSFDFKKVIKRSRRVANRLSKGVEFLFKKNKIPTFAGSGRLSPKGVIEISQNGKVSDEIKSQNVMIATGARAKSIPGVKIDGKKVITYKEAIVLDKLPKSIVIIGAGAIGAEFAYFYNAFGSKVSLIEMMPGILPIEDKEITDVLAKSFTKSGITISTDSKVESLRTDSKGVTVKVSTKEGESKEFKGEIALVATGVEPNSGNLGLEDISVELDRGFIKVNETFKSNVDGIYAIGDVIGSPLLAHSASAEGITAVESMAGLSNSGVDYNNIPSCTYCQPQVASVGMTEEKAKELGYDIKIGRFPFSANGKALAIGESEGLVKLIFDAKYGEILGAHIIGSEATEMIAELCVAKTLESTYHEILKTVHAHPTLSEAVMEAAGEAYGEAVNI